ncbi:MAG TPA: serine/threonine-protein kinase [Planctomycetota bacterium]|nr:serine/threonine-protein kinase [Planctomycetota bacterium]
MLSFEDLLAAKVAIQMGLIGPDVARKQLLAAVKSGKTLAAELEASKAVDPATAKTIAGHARRCFFLKAESVYLGFLRQKKLVDEPTIESARVKQRQEGLRARLGVILTNEGKLKNEVDQAVLAEARASFQADNAQVTERYLARGFEGIERPSVTVSEVIGQPVVAVPESNTPARSSPRPTPAPSVQRALLDFGVGMDTGPAGDIAGIGHSQERPIPAALAQAPAPKSPLAGTGLDEKYEVMKKVGEGGMGAVYLAKERNGGRQLALKVVLDQEKSKEAAQRFKREILATSMCGHENIIEIYDAGETTDGSYYMAMEYVPGEELSDIIKREGAIPPLRAMDLFEQILEGIGAVHGADIVHRDLKPQNFRVWKDAATGKERLKIMDFGIARVRNADQQFGDAFYKTMGGKITGSPAYIAPESITEPDVDGRADLYSLGIALFRMTTGKLPFTCKDPMEYLPKHLYEKPPVPSVFAPDRGITPELDKVMLKLLEKRADSRYQTAAEVLSDIRTKVRPSLGNSGPAGAASAAVFSSAEVTRPQMSAPPQQQAMEAFGVSADEKTRIEPPPAPGTIAPPPAPNVAAPANVSKPEEASEKRGCLGALFGRKKKS